MTLPRTMHMSASSVASFKACPTRHRLAYVEGIRPEESTESQRIGTNWHLLQETYCNARGIMHKTHEEAFDEAITALNNTYIPIPEWMSEQQAATERAILAASFAGYCWYYAKDEIKTLVTEYPFKLALHHPLTGLPLPIEDVVRVGKIDRIIEINGTVSISDYKSTTKAIDADSDFWNHLRLDTQISMYTMAGQELADAGLLENYGIPKGTRIAGAFYDVWRKPTIRPKKLTQSDSKKFLETGDYMGTHFEVEAHEGGYTADDTVLAWESGAKEGSIAIRETPEMFGARLLADIYERPDHYFCRRAIPRTDKDIREFRSELYSIYQTIKNMRDTGHWFHNEHACNATFTCSYISMCWHGVPFENGETPAGMKRIFVDLTREGNSVEI